MPAESVVEGRYGPVVRVNEREMINLASNDYLGMTQHPAVLEAATRALHDAGFGTGAGRVLSGTHRLHRELEARLADWVGCEAAALHPSCSAANEGLFAAMASIAPDPPLQVYSDALNHASLIDGLRLLRSIHSGARVSRYPHVDIDALRELLAGAQTGAATLVVTDGVFSMEGDQAPLQALLTLCAEHDATLIVDDSHGTGVLGATGRGTAQAQGLQGSIPVITSTIGKALAGGIGGFVAGPKSLVEMLRRHSRPYIFSNSLPPPVVAGTLAALDVLDGEPGLLDLLNANIRSMRGGLSDAGYRVLPGDHPIIPVMIGDEGAAQRLAADLREEEVYVQALTYPVVPRNEARIRVQVSAAHQEHHLATAVSAFRAHAKGEYCQ